MKKKIIIFIISSLIIILSGCNQSKEIPVTEDEIMLKIQLDLKEDIGLLIIDASINGVETSGGMSNVDKSLLKHDELLYWTFDKKDYDNPDDNVDLTIQFRVITEYFNPNYENNYPEDKTMLLDPITFNADFGNTYTVIISGSNDEGYHATFEE